jgi:regulator of protease activity HflC (stomatin/prohibitin superfamily)
MKRILSILTFVVMAFGLTACGGIIDQGNVGVRTTFGKTSPDAEQPGIYVAILSSVREYTTKESAIALDNMTPKAKDNLSLREMDITVYYKTDGAKIPGLQIKYSGQSARGEHGIWFPAYNLVENMARTAAYEEVAKQDSLTIHQHRDEVANAMKENIQKALNESDPGVFTVTRVVMRQVVTDPAIEQSILQAVQVQKQIEAKNAELELAKAEARRTVAEANGTAQRNAILNASITDNLIRYKQALAMEECASSGKCTMVIGGGVPLINTK